MNVKEALATSSAHSRNVAKINPGSIKLAEKTLYENEDVLYAVYCNAYFSTLVGNQKYDSFTSSDKKSGLVVLTENRILWCSSLLGNSENKEIKLDDITSIDRSAKKILGTTNIQINSNSFQMGIELNKVDFETMNSLLYSRKSDNNSNSKVNDYDDLRKLKSLLDDGIITQEEFDIKKKELLGL